MTRGISLFVTSSGTDIGKTFVCCRLIELLRGTFRLRCIKPIVTGFDPAAPAGSDPASLLEAQAIAVDRASLAATSPWQFRAPLSADMAAAREGRNVPFDELVAFSRAPPDVDLNLIEGIGGVMAPIDERHTVRDWIAALDAECLLVVGSYLGSLSHALTAAEVLTAIGRKPLAIVISQSQDEPVSTEATAASLEHHCESTPIIVLERNAAALDAAAVGLIRSLFAQA